MVTAVRAEAAKAGMRGAVPGRGFTCHCIRRARLRLDWMGAPPAGREGDCQMPRTLRHPLSMHLLPLLLLAALLAACGAAPPPPVEAKPATVRTSGDDGDFGAVSAPTPPPREVDVRKTTDWPSAELGSGTASISCQGDDAVVDAGVALVDLEFFSVLDAMSACQEAGVMRLHYKGRIAGDFTVLVERAASMAARMGIARRVLDLDSSGGQVEDAIRAGDAIAESNWQIHVRPEAVCHSACVLILASGDERRIAGAVGIHRIIRIQSEATSRAELSRELRQVHGEMEDYLQRNGAAVAVADLMMTVPNRGLRLLTPGELDAFGLQGPNAAQDDLERIRLARKCGEDFVRRKDAYGRAFERQCADADGDADNACALALRDRYDFPDRKCAADSPMAGYAGGVTRS